MEITNDPWNIINLPDIYIYIYTLDQHVWKHVCSLHVVCHPIHKAKQHVQVAAMRAGGHRKGMELASAPGKCLGSTFSYSFPLKILFFCWLGNNNKSLTCFFSCKLLWDFHQFRKMFFLQYFRFLRMFPISDASRLQYVGISCISHWTSHGWTSLQFSNLT